MIFERFRARLRQIVGLNESPERLAAAWTLGVGIGLSPLLGLHTVIALLAAFAFRLNKVDVLLGTLIINPWTMPVYLPAAVLLGRNLTGLVPAPGQGAELLLDPMNWRTEATALRNLIITWGVGASLATLIGAGLTYLILVRVIRAHRRRHVLSRHPD